LQKVTKIHKIHTIGYKRENLVGDGLATHNTLVKNINWES